MATVAIVLSFFLFLAFLVGLVQPSVLLGKKNPKRSKIFLFFFLPSIVLFLVAGQLTSDEYEQAWENPAGVTRLVLSKKGFDELPERLREFKDVEELVLKNNNITDLDEEILKSMPKLKKLNLENNPLKELPSWMSELQLDRLLLDGTQLETLSDEMRNSITKIEYADTPLGIKEEAEYESKKDSLATAPRTESFGDFAMRKLRGKEYGYERTFKKGVLFYTDGVPPEKIDSLGAFLIQHGYFSDERTVAMQLKYNDRKGFNAYELRAVYVGGDEPLDEELQDVFQLIAKMISKEVFDEIPVHFHLTDDHFKESLYVFRSDGKQW